jgi:hypothetical protein
VGLLATQSNKFRQMMGLIPATEHGESSFLQVFSSRGVPHGKETLLNMKMVFLFVNMERWFKRRSGTAGVGFKQLSLCG